MSSTLCALARKAGGEPRHRFCSLYRLIDLQMLYESFRSLKRKAAPGVDGVSVEDYEKDLEENLRSLHRRLIEKRYRAQNVRRRYIPKVGSKKLRPLGIPSLEDKIFKWLNRRSQRRSFTWEKFLELWMGQWQIPAPRCVERGEPAARQPDLALCPPKS